MTARTAPGNTFTPRTLNMSSVRPVMRKRQAVRPHLHGPVPVTVTTSRVR